MILFSILFFDILFNQQSLQFVKKKLFIK